MDYFMMQTDKHLRRLPQFQIPKEMKNIEDKKTIRDNGAVLVICVEGYNGLEIEYPDYIEKPIPLIADKFRSILKKYQPDTIFHRVMLTEKKAGVQKPYHLMVPPVIECADPLESIYDKAGNIIEFVLDADCVQMNRIFRIKELKNQIAVRLDVAESILRRDAGGIWFEPIKIAERNR